MDENCAWLLIPAAILVAAGLIAFWNRGNSLFATVLAVLALVGGVALGIPVVAFCL